MGRARIVWNPEKQEAELAIKTIHDPDFDLDKLEELERLEAEPIYVVTPDGKTHMTDDTTALWAAFLQVRASLRPKDPSRAQEKFIRFPRGK